MCRNKPELYAKLAEGQEPKVSQQIRNQDMPYLMYFDFDVEGVQSLHVLIAFVCCGILMCR
jgi:hypothetical protein